MTPAIARAEVRAARAAGWYQVTWNSIKKRPAPAQPAADAKPRPYAAPVRATILRHLVGKEMSRAELGEVMPGVSQHSIKSALVAMNKQGLLDWHERPHADRPQARVRVYALSEAGRAQVEALE